MYIILITGTHTSVIQLTVIVTSLSADRDTLYHESDFILACTLLTEETKGNAKLRVNNNTFNFHS